mmetsp:Transcript_845/g.2597  ORF Transcript_845/g.2597 Transcript_845/m.2597 type:complete len:87 (+) Transcript_845:586-846(+)
MVRCDPHPLGLGQTMAGLAYHLHGWRHRRPCVRMLRCLPTPHPRFANSEAEENVKTMKNLGRSVEKAIKELDRTCSISLQLDKPIS